MAKAPPPGMSVADTAKWVAMYRAIESERQDPLFHDPYARRLAGAQGEDILKRMPRARAFAWPMIVRTAIIDELLMQAIERDRVDLIVNLAAGLDARPYRMQLPANLQWVEVDYPQTIEHKSKALAGEAPRCKLERIGADLADVDSRPRLFERINALGLRGLVITEGLMVYLTREQAGRFAQDLAAQPNFRYWMTDIVAPFIMKMMKRTWSRQLASAPFRFAPEEGAAFYEQYGWRLDQYRSTFLEARRLRRESNIAWLWRLLYPRFVRQEVNRRSGPMTGVALMLRQP
ncbi:MAG TPA: class I SAM-dependent methyltransferase [Candidatus Eremiobacteraceae bacterium]|nr:class I SAM-dependent methyltransferase [Candidatus Eremiobacteraceae bacterium]